MTQVTTIYTQQNRIAELEYYPWQDVSSKKTAMYGI